MQSHLFPQDSTFNPSATLWASPSTYNFQLLCSHTFLLRISHHHLSASSRQESPNHQIFKSSNHCAVTFFYSGTPITKSSNLQITKSSAVSSFFLRNKKSAPLDFALGKHQQISTSINQHLLHQPLLFRLHNNKVNPFSVYGHRKISGIVSILYSERLRMNNFPLHIIHQQLAGFTF
jgi:hypothetical protein